MDALTNPFSPILQKGFPYQRNYKENMYTPDSPHLTTKKRNKPAHPVFYKDQIDTVMTNDGKIDNVRHIDMHACALEVRTIRTLKDMR